MPLEIISGGIAFLITLMILSYLIGDNSAFRFSVHILVGVAAGYVAAVAWWQVIFPRLILPLIAGPADARAATAVPLFLSGLLLMKAWPRFSRLGAPPLGVLVGISSAVAVGGALEGTLLPQLISGIDLAAPARIASMEGILNGALVLAGFVASLLYFQFTGKGRGAELGKRPVAIEFVAGIGAIFLAVTLGILFAGVYSAALTALIERLRFLGSFVGLR